MRKRLRYRGLQVLHSRRQFEIQALRLGKRSACLGAPCLRLEGYAEAADLGRFVM